jgi:hypothetical protein
MITPTKFTESSESADPFAALYSTGPVSSLYISGRLTLLRIPVGVCGEWTSLNFITSHSTWHRRLDANAFLWLRAAARRTIEAGKLATEFSDAEQCLDQIAAIAIADGAHSPPTTSRLTARRRSGTRSTLGCQRGPMRLSLIFFRQFDETTRRH